MATETEKLIAQLERIKPGLENSSSAAEDAMVELLPDVIAALRRAKTVTRSAFEAGYLAGSNPNIIADMDSAREAYLSARNGESSQ